MADDLTNIGTPAEETFVSERDYYRDIIRLFIDTDYGREEVAWRTAEGEEGKGDINYGPFPLRLKTYEEWIDFKVRLRATSEAIFENTSAISIDGYMIQFEGEHTESEFDGFVFSYEAADKFVGWVSDPEGKLVYIVTSNWRAVPATVEEKANAVPEADASETILDTDEIEQPAVIDELAETTADDAPVGGEQIEASSQDEDDELYANASETLPPSGDAKLARLASFVSRLRNGEAITTTELTPGERVIVHMMMCIHDDELSYIAFNTKSGIHNSWNDVTDRPV